MKEANGVSELEMLRAELKAAQMRLERMREAIGNISHELRAPITLIQGYLEGLLEGVISDPDKQRKSLELIYAKVTAMNRLVTDLNQLSALEAQQLRFEMRPVSVRSLAMRLKSQFEPDVEQAGCRFLVTAEPILNDRWGLLVNVDLQRLDQVFMNLFTNAFRHLPEAGGQIDVHFERAGDGLLVRVKDNGEGIDAEDLPFIFDRYYIGKAVRDERYRQGIGIGLSICREIVAAHGGSIKAASKRGEGTEIMMILPFTERTRTVSQK